MLQQIFFRICLKQVLKNIHELFGINKIPANPVIFVQPYITVYCKIPTNILLTLYIKTQTGARHSKLMWVIWFVKPRLKNQPYFGINKKYFFLRISSSTIFKKIIFRDYGALTVEFAPGIIWFAKS